MNAASASTEAGSTEAGSANAERASLQPPLRFSIALCTYNGARYLREQLDSFVAQTYLPAELVVCDDGSTDETFSMLEAFAQTAPFSVQLWRNHENLGYSRNFAQAIGHCSGDLIALADQDDRWQPNKLERLVQLFRADETVAGIFSDGGLMDTESKPLPGGLWSSFGFGHHDQRKLSAGHAVEVLLQRNVVTGMAFAFRAAWRECMQNMPASWPHDAWLALMMAIDGKLLACPERLVTYRVHGQQQIGVPITRAQKQTYFKERGVGAYLALSRNRNLRQYRRDAAQYADLVTALQDGPPPHKRWLRQARAKADHLREAAERLRTPRLRRAPHVLSHWQDYRRYSPTGLKAMVRDLLLSADQE